MLFKNRTALITGGARGLGWTYAVALAEAGANIVISDSGADRDGVGMESSISDKAAAALRERGHRAIAHSGDLEDESECHALIVRAISEFQGLDIIIHNAGWVGYQAIDNAQADFLERSLAVNVWAPMWLAKYAWPHLKSSTAPRIVLTTSDRAMYACYGQKGLAAYAAGKMAQIGLMNALALEGYEHGIRVNAVSPVARTRMWGETGTPSDLKPEWVTPGTMYLASYLCNESGYILRASNGQFSATRFEENPGIDYPRDLNRIYAASVDEMAAQWEVIKEHGHVR
ncbi:MAG: SDR family NAD(P)-dependent oxidoreductase [Halomonadaceae bacterium]|uniref:SDR family NAD(P)-dependent oxidoreductase n=1 Tax=Halomonas colorata TaxID=2742615 RepID=A0ABR9FZ32_9GAMM|nr:SDR family NAD(P)-dependent oxidoreductase [Halomonas colorata]MBE0463885.1 SDR family NAD(P)-dependent oxidoreductase [Halomonas colorata]